MIKFICLTFLVLVTPPFLEAQEKFDPESWIRGMEESYAAMDNYTAIFHKQEHVNGKLKEKETISVKFKKPFKVYMKWIEAPYKGREALYAEGWNENRMTIYERTVVGGVTVNLDPKGLIAMTGNRHPITESGLGQLIKLIAENVRRGIRNGDFTLQKQREEVVYGRMTQKFKLIFPKDKAKGYYCFQAIINLDSERKIPLRVRIYDWNHILIEDYGYQDVKINPGLIDADFDPKNPKYKFY